MARGSLGLGGEARRVDEHDPSRLAALRTTPAAPWCFGKRASLARLALPVQRLLGWNLTAVLIYVMDIERSIRMQEERTRSADAGELVRSEEHTSELQSLRHLVCRLLLEKKKKKKKKKNQKKDKHNKKLQ